MVRFVSLALAIAVACPPALAQTATESLAYSLAPVESAGRVVALDVRVSFRLGADGTAVLEVPYAWAGATGMDRNIENLRSATPGVALAPDGRVPFVDVRGTPGEQVEIDYRVAKHWDGPLARPNYFQPVFDGDRFFVAGAGLFVYPADFGARRSVSIEWTGVPPETFGDCLGLRVRSGVAALDEGQLQNCAVYGGGFREISLSLNGSPVAVLVAGTWALPDSAIAARAGRILGMERAFWGGGAYAPFAVVLLPTQDAPGNYGGTAYTNLFAMYVPQTNPLGAAFDYLLAHEYFHTWNPRRLFEPQRPEAEEYWFSEGFTDYYAYRLLFRAGMLSPPGYVESIDRELREYWLSPNRGMSNADITKHYFEPGVTTLDYLRGTVLAMRWERDIRARSHGARGLDDTMRAIARAGAGAPAGSAAIAARFARDAGPQAIADERAFVERGDLSAPPPGLFGDCAPLRLETIYAFDAGFDYRGSGRHGTLRGVVPDGPAFRAGLRDGQTFSRNGIAADARFPVDVRVVENGATRTIRYFPRGAGVAVPQYVPLMPSAAFSACLKRAG